MAKKLREQIINLDNVAKHDELMQKIAKVGLHHYHLPQQGHISFTNAPDKQTLKATQTLITLGKKLKK